MRLYISIIAAFFAAFLLVGSFAYFWLTPKPGNVELFLNTAHENFAIPFNGIIHIGASDGMEEYLYRKNGFQNILLIEADPSVAAQLAKRLENSAITTVASFAATDKNGIGEFIQTNNQVSSSLLELDNHLKLYPDIKEVNKIQVKLQKLDDYLLTDPRNTQYNILVLDIQGAELMALKGAAHTLKQIDCIISEVEFDPLYKGAVVIEELDDYLLTHDFIRVDTHSTAKAWGDALYVKRSFVSLGNS
jgi:FkbM family methyltransferase